jgi:hypothetical protein
MKITVSYQILPAMPLNIRIGSISRPARNRSKKILYLPPVERHSEDCAGNQYSRQPLVLALEGSIL